MLLVSDELPEADKTKMNFGAEGDTELKAWRDIWSAGQSVSGIGEVMPVQALVDRMAGEYDSVRSRLARGRDLLRRRLTSRGHAPTAAILGTVPWARRARSSIVGSRSGGRLSATNQSRSSRDFAAVLRPAPDIPVIMTISGVLLSASAGSSALTAHLPR